MEEIAKSVDTTTNNTYDGGHKYVLGPTQTNFSPSRSERVNSCFRNGPWT